jgi:hypothetical protein
MSILLRQGLIFALDGHLLTGLAIEINFLFAFLLEQLIPGDILLNLIGGHYRLGGGLNRLGSLNGGPSRPGRRSRCSRPGRRRLNDRASVVDIDNPISGILMHSNGIHSTLVPDYPSYRCRAAYMSFADHGRLHWLWQGGEHQIVCLRKEAEAKTGTHQ